MAAATIYTPTYVYVYIQPRWNNQLHASYLQQWSWQTILSTTTQMLMIRHVRPLLERDGIEVRSVRLMGQLITESVEIDLRDPDAFARFVQQKWLPSPMVQAMARPRTEKELIEGVEMYASTFPAGDTSYETARPDAIRDSIRDTTAPTLYLVVLCDTPTSMSPAPQSSLIRRVVSASSESDNDRGMSTESSPIAQNSMVQLGRWCGYESAATRYARVETTASHIPTITSASTSSGSVQPSSSTSSSSSSSSSAAIDTTHGTQPTATNGIHVQWSPINIQTPSDELKSPSSTNTNVSQHMRTFSDVDLPHAAYCRGHVSMDMTAAIPTQNCTNTNHSITASSSSSSSSVIANPRREESPDSVQLLPLNAGGSGMSSVELPDLHIGPDIQNHFFAIPRTIYTKQESLVPLALQLNEALERYQAIVRYEIPSPLLPVQQQQQQQQQPSSSSSPATSPCLLYNPEALRGAFWLIVDPFRTIDRLAPLDAVCRSLSIVISPMARNNRYTATVSNLSRDPPLAFPDGTCTKFLCGYTCEPVCSKGNHSETTRLVYWRSVVEQLRDIAKRWEIFRQQASIQCRMYMWGFDHPCALEHRAFCLRYLTSACSATSSECRYLHHEGFRTSIRAHFVTRFSSELPSRCLDAFLRLNEIRRNLWRRYVSSHLQIHLCRNYQASRCDDAQCMRLHNVLCIAYLCDACPYDHGDCKLVHDAYERDVLYAHYFELAIRSSFSLQQIEAVLVDPAFRKTTQDLDTASHTEMIITRTQLNLPTRFPLI